MSTDRLLALDLLVSVLTAATWLGAGTAAALRRTRVAAGLSVAAVLVSVLRIGSVLMLGGRGWWFVQEKALVGGPLLAVAALAAAVVAGPRLAAALAGQGRPVAASGDGPAAGPLVVVPLLTAGYASVAGLLVTVLLGYPAGWPVGLGTVALVGAAALVTWWMLAGGFPKAPAAAVLALGLVGIGFTVVPAEAVPTPHHGRSVRSLRGPATPALGGEVRRFTLTARTATVALASGRRVAAWTFDGKVPGPALTVSQGDLVEVRLRNADIAAGVTLHWHGYDVPAGEDGVPGLTQRAVRPGETFRYRLRADQVGTYWYHTHSVSDRGVRLGLYGTLVVTPRGAPRPGLDLTLPVHTYGDTVVFGRDDRPVAHRVAPGTPVRLRLVNTDSTPHRFTLAGTPYRLVAVDGNDLHRPTDLTRVGLRLPAGGRYDLAFRMPDRPVALLAGDDPGTGLRLAPGGGDATVPDTAGWPELDLLRYGAPTGTPFGRHSRFDRDFTLVLDRGLALIDGRPGYAHTVNGRAHPAIPTDVVAEGELVRFTVVNRSRETHPWHLHGHRVRVLSRDGRPPTGSPLLLDTFDVRPGEVWQVGFRADNPGVWMNHCHNLGHAEQGMSLHLGYQGVTTPFHGGHG